jgi:hypothetical protein
LDRFDSLGDEKIKLLLGKTLEESRQGQLEDRVDEIHERMAPGNRSPRARARNLKEDGNRRGERPAERLNT